MDLIVYKLIVEDRDTGTLYETDYKFEHSLIADVVMVQVVESIVGYDGRIRGIEEALDNQILKEYKGEDNA